MENYMSCVISWNSITLLHEVTIHFFRIFRSHYGTDAHSHGDSEQVLVIYIGPDKQFFFSVKL